MSRSYHTRPPTPRHRKLVLLPDHLSLLFSLTEPLPSRRTYRNRDLTRWTFPRAGLPAVHEQEYLNDNTFTKINGLVEAYYDQVLALIDPYTQE